jgi:hypothetical protein
MKITIVPTETLTTIDGGRCRLWEGITDRGVACKVFVCRVAVRDDQDTEEFERTLQEQLPPGRTFPLSMIL